MTRGRWPDEVEATAFRPLDQDDDLPLFGGASIPKRPIATTAEQPSLALDGTISGDYDRWRQTDDGKLVLVYVTTAAMRALNAGETRIGVKGLVEQARRDLKVQVNNSHTALIARELHDRYPALRPLIEMRVRKAT